MHARLSALTEPSQARAPPALLTEVCQLQLPPLVDEQVLRFEVTMQDLPPVAVRQTSQQLEHEDLGEGGRGRRGTFSAAGQ